jgi:hypothetical protein
MTSNRRAFLLAGASALAVGGLPGPVARAFSFGDAIKGIGVAVFPGAAAALGGFGLVQTVNLISNLNSLVDQTKNLETHIDQVLTEVSGTLRAIQGFVQDCQRTLQDIEALIKDLPQVLASAFNAVVTRDALGKLLGDSANMSGYLNSKGAIIENRARIQDLCQAINEDIFRLATLESNALQFAMHTVPALTTWMQGYTAYNLLLDPDRRSSNPWDNQLVSALAVPKMNGIIQSIKDQRASNADLMSRVPLDQRVLYTFDGSKFAATDKPFAYEYGNAAIDNGLYYTIWPNDANWQGPTLPPMPNPVPPPPRPVLQAGDFCYLVPGALRFWATAPSSIFVMPTTPVELVSAQRANSAFVRLLASSLKSVVAFNQLSDGWQDFEQTKNRMLVNVDKTSWAKMPRLPTT